jgi:Domain of unknown function (DUF397)
MGTWRKSTYSGTNGGNCVEVMETWRKSTYSGTNGGQCVEVMETWRKSTYSGTNGGDCVEVADGSVILVRDTTDRGGVTIEFSAAAWARFIKTL